MTLLRNKNKQKRGSGREGGMTLVELMVTVLLTAILMAGLFYMMTGQDRTYKNQMRTLTAQENLWGAMEYLQAEVRKAGFGFSGCSGNMKSVLDASVFGSSTAGMFTAMLVYNNTNKFREFAGLGGVNDGTDTIALQYYISYVDGGTGPGIKITKEMPASSANLVISASGGIQKDDLIVICAPGSEWGTVLQATKNVVCNDKDSDGDGQKDCKVEHNPAAPWNPPGGHNIFPPGGYGAGATVVKISGDPTESFFYYAIDNSRDPPLLVRWKGSNPTDREVIAEGVEDLQVSWTCDSNDNLDYEEGTTAATRQSDDWANNVAGDTVPTCDNKPIRMVRITLVTRTVSPMLGNRTGFRPAVEDHAAGTPADDLAATGGVGTYGRATLTGKVKPRNIRSTE